MASTSALNPLRSSILSASRRISILPPSRIAPPPPSSSPVVRSLPRRPFSSSPRLRSSADEVPYLPRESPKTKQVQEYTGWLALLGAVPIVCAYLTWWQIKRLQWKLELIDELELNLMRAPLRLPDVVTDEDQEIYNWRKVVIKGHFLPFTTPGHRNPVKIGPRVIEGDTGYHLILPFLRTSNDPNGPTPRAILINLGFIKKDLIDSEGMRAIKIPQGEVELEGMLRRGRGESAEKRSAGKKPSMFTPDNDELGGEWFWIDTGGFAEYYSNEQTGDVMPLICDLTYDGDIPKQMLIAQGIPVGRPAKVELRNQHLIYAATWASLGSVTAVLFAMVWKRGKKVRPVMGRMGR